MSLLRNSVANLMGGGLPALVMIITTPVMVSKLGLVDYGLLTIITAVIGYFSFIDINLTAGVVKFVSEYRAVEDRARECQTIVLGFLIYGAVGLFGALAVYTFALPLALHGFSISESQLTPAVTALRIGAVGFLVGQLQQYFNSLPQAIQRYDVSAKLDALFGVLVPLVSVAALLSGGGIVQMMLIRVCASTLHLAALLFTCRRLFPEFRWSNPSRALARTVMSFSGFSYLSKLASLTYAHADKLIIGSLLGMEAVTLYSVPATVINRFLGLTFRMSSVVFPAASDLSARGDLAGLRKVYLELTRNVTFLNGAIVALAVVFGHELLYYWIGSSIANAGWPVFLLIALAMFMDSLTNIPSLVNDGLGHARVSGFFALIRAILGVLVTYIFAGSMGIIGVAIGHLLASALMTGAFLIFVHGRSLPYSLKDFIGQALSWPLIAIAVPAVAVWWLRPVGLMSLYSTLLAGALMGIVFLLIGWHLLIDIEDRKRFLKRFGIAKGVT